MPFQFVSEEHEDESVQERPRQDEQRAGHGAEGQERSKQVEEQQEQEGPVAGQRPQAQSRPPPLLRPPPRRRTLRQGAAGICFSQVTTTQTTQEVWPRAEGLHVTSKLTEGPEGWKTQATVFHQ